MIKTVIKEMCICDMCGYAYTWNEHFVVPNDVFEFTVNLEDGARKIQICPRCQVKLKTALKESINGYYGAHNLKKEEEDD